VTPSVAASDDTHPIVTPLLKKSENTHKKFRMSVILMSVFGKVFMTGGFNDVNTAEPAQA